jgi:hypothetical protein
MRRSPNALSAFASSQRSFFDRLRLAVVLGEVDVYEFAQPRCLDEALFAPEPFERPRECLGRGLFRGEATTLHTPRATPSSAIPVRPHRPAVSVPSLQFEYLTLLRHHARPRNRFEEHVPHAACS